MYPLIWIKIGKFENLNWNRRCALFYSNSKDWIQQDGHRRNVLPMEISPVREIHRQHPIQIVQIGNYISDARLLQWKFYLQYACLNLWTFIIIIVIELEDALLSAQLVAHIFFIQWRGEPRAESSSNRDSVLLKLHVSMEVSRCSKGYLEYIKYISITYLSFCVFTNLFKIKFLKTIELACVTCTKSTSLVH